MDNLSDGALVAGLKTKDAAATKQFMEQYWAASVRFARSLTGDDNAAEDIAQDALVLALEKIDTFQEGRAFRPWFLKIVENRAREFRRGRNRRRRRDARDWTLPIVQAPVQSIEEKEQADLIREHLSKLDDDCRTILSLRFIESLSLKDISQSMDCPEGTVSTKIRRGLESLSRSLSPLLSVSPAAVGPLLGTLRAQESGTVGQLSGTGKGPAYLVTASLGSKVLSVALVLAVLPFIAMTTSLVTGRSDPMESSQRVALKPVSGSDLDLGNKESLAIDLINPGRGEENFGKDPGLTAQTNEEARATVSGSRESAIAREGNGEKTVRVARVLFRVVDGSGRPLNTLRLRLSRGIERSGTTSLKEVSLLEDVETDAYGEVNCALDPEDTLFTNGDRIELRDNRRSVLGLFNPMNVENGTLDIGTIVITRPNFSSITARLEYNGQAVTGAEVHFLSVTHTAESGEQREWLAEAKSDQRGRGTWYFGFPDDIDFNVQLEVEAEGYSFVSKLVRVSGGHQESVLTLKPAEKFSGHVVDPWGKAVPGAMVSVEGMRQYTKTDALGRFQLDHLTRGKSYQLTIYPPKNCALLTKVQNIVHGAKKTEFSLALGGELEVTVKLPEGIAFHGFLGFFLQGKTRDGKSIDRLVKITGDWPLRVSNIPPGRYILKGLAYSNLTAGYSREFELSSDGRKLEVVVQYQLARKIVGRIVDGLGKGVYGLRLTPTKGDEINVHSDHLGRFRFDSASREGFSIGIFSEGDKLVKRMHISPGSGKLDLGDIVIIRK